MDRKTTRIAGLLLAVLGLGGLATGSPPIIGCAVILAVALCGISAEVRILWVVLGGMLVLQTSQDMNITKAAYFVGAVAALAFSFERAWRSRHSDAAVLMGPVFVGSGLFLVVVLGSAVTAFAHSTGPLPWLRDALPYGLFAIAPIFALDANMNMSPQYARGSLIILGVLAAASFAIEWLALRHLADLPFTRLLLPSYSLAVALFCFGSGAALLGQHRVRLWIVVMAFIAGAILVTGTRSGLLIGAAPTAVALVGERASLGLRLKRFIALVPWLAGGTLLFAVLIAAATGADLGRSVQRLVSVVDIPAGAGGGAEIRPSAGPGAGEGLPFERLSPAVAAQSSTQRAIQGRIALLEFLSSPLIGTGPGRVLLWEDQFGVTHSSFNLDTPMAVPAKFGVLGVLALVAYVLSIGVYLIRLNSSRVWTIGAAGLVALAAVWTLMLPLNFPFEDKGFSFGLLLLLALSLPAPSRVAGVDGRPQRPLKIGVPPALRAV